jgi:alpha-beta hydrolase superfamily lysophospholipase
MQVIQADRNAHTGPSSGPTEADLASFAAMQKFVSKQLGGRLPEAELRQTILETAGGRVGDQKAPSFVYDSIINGEQKYKATRIPVLVIEALPPNMGRPAGADTAKLAADRAIHTEKALKQLQAFQAGNPSARIIKIPNAYHYIYLSNEAEVLKAISEFMDGDPVQH